MRNILLASVAALGLAINAPAFADRGQDQPMLIAGGDSIVNTQTADGGDYGGNTQTADGGGYPGSNETEKCKEEAG